jgi:putative zinc finger protein
MTFGHDDIRERLVEYLYEELDGSARAAFDGHLAACATCRADTEAAGRARGVARSVVRAPLGDTVPLGLRARVLEAAAAAAKERSSRASAAAAPVVTMPASAARAVPPISRERGIPLGGRETSSVGSAPERSNAPKWQGWIGRLRGRWTFPTFATVGALAVFLLVRGTIFREARRPLGEAPAERIGAGAPAVSPPPAPTRPQDFESGEMKGALGSDERRRALLEDTERAAPGGGADDRAFKRKGPARHRTRVAVPGGSGQGEVLDREAEVDSGALRNAPSRPAKRDANGTSPAETNRPGGATVPDDGRKRADRQDELRKGVGVDARSSAERRPAPIPGPAAASAPAPGSATMDRPRSLGGGTALDVETGAGPHPSSAAMAPSRSDDLLEGSLPSLREGSAGFAQPPPPPPARGGHLAPDPGSPPPSASKPSAGATGPALSAPAAPAPEPPRPSSARASAPVHEDRLLSAPKKAKNRSADKVEAAAEQVEQRAAAPAADPAIALSDRAAKLLAARRFTEASAAYRDLLRRFPTHPSAPLWRSRLAASDRAAASESTGFATPPPPK